MDEVVVEIPVAVVRVVKCSSPDYWYTKLVTPAHIPSVEFLATSATFFTDANRQLILDPKWRWRVLEIGPTGEPSIMGYGSRWLEGNDVVVINQYRLQVSIRNGMKAVLTNGGLHDA